MGINCFGMCDFKEIEKISKKLIKKMRTKFPNCSYTVWVLAWDDYTFKVECKYGEDFYEKQALLHVYTYYDGKIEYSNCLVDKINN